VPIINYLCIESYRDTGLYFTGDYPKHQIGSRLILTGDSSSAIGVPHQDERSEQSCCSTESQPSLPSREDHLIFRKIGHALGSIVHRLRSNVHSLLGGEVFYVTLAGLGFALLAGKGAS
jgi:hypothetical protein